MKNVSYIIIELSNGFKVTGKLGRGRYLVEDPLGLKEYCKFISGSKTKDGSDYLIPCSYNGQIKDMTFQDYEKVKNCKYSNTLRSCRKCKLYSSFTGSNCCRGSDGKA